MKTGEGIDYRKGFVVELMTIPSSSDTWSSSASSLSESSSSSSSFGDNLFNPRRQRKQTVLFPHLAKKEPEPGPKVIDITEEEEMKKRLAPM